MFNRMTFNKTLPDVLYLCFEMNQCIQKFFLFIFSALSLLSISSAFICENGQQISYLFSPDRALPYMFTTIVKMTKVSLKECETSCTKTFSCGSIAYDQNTQSCVLKTRTVQSGSELVYEQGLDYYEKICLTVNRTVCSDGLLRLPQQFLVGFARQVLTVPSLNSCIAHCFETIEPYSDYNCASLLYYYNDHSCILNAETVRNYPDLLTNSNPQEGRVDYLDNDCFQGTVHLDNDCFQGWAQWTPWGTCFPNGTQIRQRFCSANNGVCQGKSYDTQRCQVEDFNTGSRAVTVCPEARFYFGCNQYCKNFTQLGYTNYPDCLRGGGKPNAKPRRPSRSIDYSKWNRVCKNYYSLGYKTYPDCLRDQTKLI